MKIIIFASDLDFVEDNRPILTALLYFARSALKVINNDMRYLSFRYSDTPFNAIYEDVKFLEEILQGNFAKIDEVKPYVIPVLRQTVSYFPMDIFDEFHGWTKKDINSAIVTHLASDELRRYIKQTFPSL